MKRYFFYMGILTGRSLEHFKQVPLTELYETHLILVGLLSEFIQRYLVISLLCYKELVINL